jgi:hypothetical protein
MEQMNLPNIDVKQAIHTWPNYWGGVTQSTSPPMIHAKIRELRLAVGGLAAKKQAGGPMFPVRGAKELAQKLAQALCDLDLVAPVVAQDVNLLPTDAIPANSTSSGKPVFRTLAHVKSTVRLGASDGSFVDMVGSGHGGDVDDKAGGKADTYGWKIALLKGLTIPEQDMLDTDNDSSDTTEKPVKPAKTEKAEKAAAKTEAGGQLDAVLARIEIADEVDLEAIREGIKGGTIELAGADKLRASAAFMARSKKLKDAPPSE